MISDTDHNIWRVQCCDGVYIKCSMCLTDNTPLYPILQTIISPLSGHILIYNIFNIQPPTNSQHNNV